jgi:MFS family permease
MLPGLITPENVVMVIMVGGIIISTGIAMADTALDGLILDICPKETLGRAQGTCWGFRSLGQIAGGPLLAYLIIALNLRVESLFIAVGFLIIIGSFLMLTIKEIPVYEDIDIKGNLKQMFTNKKDWQMYTFAIFNAFIDGVVLVFMSIYILIQMGVISAEGVTLEVIESSTNTDLYILQANITLWIGLGIIAGAIIGGLYSDLKSRRYSVYLSLIVTTITILLMIIPTFWIILLFFAAMTGVGMGWRHSAYSAVLGELSKRYPEMDSTYFSIANSFVNIGTAVGLTVIGIVFEQTGSFIIGFLLMAIFNNLGLFPFLLLKSKDYELSKNLSPEENNSTPS